MHENDEANMKVDVDADGDGNGYSFWWFGVTMFTSHAVQTSDVDNYKGYFARPFLWTACESEKPRNMEIWKDIKRNWYC